MATVSFQHRIEYPDNEGITLPDIAETLLAHDRIVRILPLVLQAGVDGLTVQKLEISLSEAEEGSLFLQFVVQVWTIYQENIQDRVIEIVQTMTGTEIPSDLHPIITLLILLLIFYGAVWLYRRVHPTGESDAIRGDYNRVLNITARHLHITSDRLEDILDDATKGPVRRGLAKASQRFFQPAKRNGNGRINVPGYGEISRETVADVPSNADIEAIQEETDTVPIPQAKIHLRAYDLDRRERGWFGLVEGENFADVRLPITLYPTIDPESLKGQTEITGDVLIERQRDNGGDWIPRRRIHILNLTSHPGH